MTEIFLNFNNYKTYKQFKIFKSCLIRFKLLRSVLIDFIDTNY
jgi:hypothetical protein